MSVFAIYILGGFAILFGALAIWFAYKYLQMAHVIDGFKKVQIDNDEQKRELNEAVDHWMIEHDKIKEKLNRTVHQKKSSEVKLGKIGENLAPFTHGWPWDANHFRFLGSPVDGVQFTDDEIIFVEIKTGKSRLSKYQAKCRDLIEAGKVRFVSFRIGEDGIEIK